MDFDRICLNCMTENLKESVCHFCGFDNNSEQAKGFLPHKKMLANRYFTGHIIRKDGDSVIYMGYDTKLNSPVHIREFFPEKISRRIPESYNIAPRREAADLYNQELSVFLTMSRTLSTMKNLSCLFPIYDIFKENGTAYTISEYIMSMTFEEYLVANDGALSYDKIVDIFAPFMDSLALVHSAGICHYGISPQTIYMCENGKLRLDGFALKQARMANSSVYASQIVDGYAPIEQYDYDEFAIGEAADVYSLAAVIFKAITGKAPAKATERMSNPRLSIPSRLANSLPTYSLSAIANALAPEAESRTSNLEEFKNDFLDIHPAVSASDPADVPDDTDDFEEEDYRPRTVNQKSNGLSTNTIAAIAAVVTFVVVIGIGFLIYSLKGNEGNVTETTTAPIDTSSLGDGIPAGETYLENLIGEEFNLDELKEAYPNFVIEQTEDAFSDKYEAGIICAQEPAGNQTIANGALVKITVSKGESTVKIPKNLIGLKYEEAAAKLKEAGYQNIRQADSYDGSCEIGYVVAVDPDEGTNYDVKNLVILHVNVLDPNA